MDCKLFKDAHHTIVVYVLVSSYNNNNVFGKSLVAFEITNGLFGLRERERKNKVELTQN